MTLPARAAAIRGDDYQHTIGWLWAARMLRDLDTLSVSIEDAGGGSFDDIVVQRAAIPHTYIQAKSSNHADVVIDAGWLLTPATATGESPLAHFYNTFVALRDAAELFELEVWTVRGFDHTNPLLGKLLDRKTDRIDTDAMVDSSRRTKIGRERDAWAKHLDISVAELRAFLDVVAWKHTSSQADLRRQIKDAMELAGLRRDDEAVTLGTALVREWVTDGAGPQGLEDVRAAVASRNLLALDGELLFVVHGVDADPTASPPNVARDFVNLYEGDDSFSRKQLADPGDWDAKVKPSLETAAKELSTFGIRRVRVGGSMRYPMWFAAGRALPEVKKWVLSVEQVGAVWSTDASPEPVEPRVLASQDLDAGSDLVIVVALTHDPTDDISAYLAESGLPAGRLVVFGPDEEPSKTSVPSDTWAMGWSRAARDLARAEAKSIGAKHVHLFVVCPAGVVLMLGHQWNVMPKTTIYEYADGSYFPTITFAGA